MAADLAQAIYDLAKKEHKTIKQTATVSLMDMEGDNFEESIEWYVDDKGNNVVKVAGVYDLMDFEERNNFYQWFEGVYKCQANMADESQYHMVEFECQHEVPSKVKDGTIMRTITIQRDIDDSDDLPMGPICEFYYNIKAVMNLRFKFRDRDQSIAWNALYNK